MPKALQLPPLFVVEVFDLLDGALVRTGRRAAVDAGAAEGLARALADGHAGVVAWTQAPEAGGGEYGPRLVLFRNGELPATFGR